MAIWKESMSRFLSSQLGTQVIILTLWDIRGKLLK
jgi:hypothetical protein